MAATRDEPLPFDALVLLFGMIPWNFRVDILLVLVLATAVYLTGWSRLRRQADGAATLSGLAPLPRRHRRALHRAGFAGGTVSPPNASACTWCSTSCCS